ncbi:MAG: RNA polymerase sigma factor [Gammaproteobacteria bacterium]|nr:RNA polymerase sigma factor [Gammaproteobacteria bacterium]
MIAINSLPSAAALFSVPAVTYAAAMDHVPEDSALMLRYRDGDVSAFEILYRRHNDALYRYLLRLCQNRDTAEDVFQEVWGKIIKARERYRPTAKFTTFLYRVAHNCFIDHLRRNQRHDRSVNIDPDTQHAVNVDPDAEIDRSLARQRLESALKDLPDEQRDVFLLYEEADLSLDEIALVTGVNRETAKSRLRYAVNKLKAAISAQIADSLETS